MVASPAIALLLLWLVGVNLRTVLLGVPPTLPTLHRSLSLSYSAAGLLTSVPVLMMAAGAVPGALIVSRLGLRRTVVAGLTLIVAGTALRGAIPAVATLFLFTLVLSLGIAITQPALPSLVRSWFPQHIARATAVYSNGLLVGEVVGATVTIPFLLNRLGLGWQGALAAWAMPVGICLLLWLLLAPLAVQREATSRDPWFPDWRSGRMWRMGILMGGTSAIYFGMNTWIPDTLQVRGGGNLIPLSLGLLNLMQLPMSLAAAVAGDAWLGRRWPYVVAGVGCVVGLAGYVLAPVATAPLWASFLGAGSGLVFILNLGLPPLLAPARDVVRVSAFMLMIGYSCAFFGPALGGGAWDATGIWMLALFPIGIGSLVIISLGASFPRLSRSARAA